MNESIDKYSRRVEIGYFSAQSVWGNGYMTESLGAVVVHNFEQLGMIRQQAWVFPENKASARVLVKNGFAHEGTLRQYVKHPDGTNRDVEMYGCVADS
ncbi:MAG: GNAT family protein, partial [Chloroflexota bacterium]